MVKNFRNTIIVLMFMFLISWCILIAKTNDTEDELIVSMKEVSLNDDELKKFGDFFNNNELLRRASFDRDIIENDEMLKFILTGISPDYYITRLGSNNETICYIDSIDFTYEQECLFRIIDNETIVEYQKKLFNIDNTLIFNDVYYKNLECKNNGTSYYCLVKSYDNNIRNYSVIDSVYVSDEKYVIRDYYINIDMKNIKECSNYFNYNYCMNYPNIEAMHINTDMVKYKGVLFEYVFTKDNDYFYLDSFHIVK